MTSRSPSKWVWFVLGAMVPLVLTGLTYAVGVYMSTRTEGDIGPIGHAFNAWHWVQLGLLVSLTGGGLSLFVLLQTLLGADRKEAHSAIWRFLGGCAAFVVIAGAVFGTV